MKSLTGVTIRLRMLRDVHTLSAGILKAGTVHEFELLQRGRNWRRVRLPSGKAKTLFHFDAMLERQGQGGAL